MSEKHISMIGAGKMASILGRNFAEAGHSVFIGARNTEKAMQLANELGQGVQGGTIDEAVQHGAIIFIAIPYSQIQDTLKSLGTSINQSVA